MELEMFKNIAVAGVTGAVFATLADAAEKPNIVFILCKLFRSTISIFCELFTTKYIFPSF
jgi:hypothetical protein